MMEALAREFYPELPMASFSGKPAFAVTEGITKRLDRWPNQAAQVGVILDVMREGAEIRNWLVHAWVLQSPDGDWVELQKPMKATMTWGRRRITFNEVDMLAARFVWVMHAVTRVVEEHSWESEQSSRTDHADPFPEAPPLPDFKALN